jgi:uncharacterized protein YyaL (SSP411 family)
VFLTPRQKPFYVGTYFPRDAGHYGIPGFRTILLQLAEAYESKKQEIEAASGEFMVALSQTARDVSTGVQRAEKVSLERSILDEAAIGLLHMGDQIYGGFGQAPKFPNVANLMFLLRYYDLSAMTRFREFVAFTADNMAKGGIHDHLGGGFARYSTDQKWLIPHFEKMLYDNALLAQLYTELYQITKNDKYIQVTKKILDYVMRDMTHPEGGFYSAEDADSEGEEGKFYLWHKKEIAGILGNQTANDILCDHYGVIEGGNFEGKNILNIRVSVPSLAQKYGKTPEQIAEIIADNSAKLFAARQRRVRPGRDEKILTSWNGLMISGFAKGYAITGDTKYLTAATKAVNFIKTKIASADGRLHRTFKDGQSKLNAYLDDYAFYVGALLDLFTVDSRHEYLNEAVNHTDFMLQHFWDANEGNFFFTSDDHEKLIVRTKNFYDLAIPSGNSVEAANLLRLYHYSHNDGYLGKATSIMKAGARPAAENPFGFGQLLMAIYLYVKKPVEVTVITNNKNPIMAGWLNRQFLPDGINAIVHTSELEMLQQEYPYFQGRAGEGNETAFVCRNFTCSLPIRSQEELEKQVGLKSPC